LRCTSCGTGNEAGRKFCIQCGARLGSGCPTCGAPIPVDARFCGECGASLADARLPDAAAPPRPEPAGPVAERRLVSVLFADLVGFTPFAEERDAELVRETLTRYFELASEVIGRYGGTVEKFIGDAVMAVWGAPTAREDDAERAVRAGLELVDTVRSLGPAIAARAGVLTGEAAVTIGATNQGMVAGDLVNTAARLQSVAPAGAVLVGEATHRAASRAIVFEPAGEQELKGKHAPVAAWRAMRVVSERGGRNRTDALEAPFVGRDEELRMFKDLFHATGREKRARLVSIVGPAGIGKTRLAWEFLKYVDGLLETVWWHSGRSPAYGDGITFWALGEMVRGRCGLVETDDEPTTRAKVAQTVAERIPDADERRWIEPALLALLGLESGIAAEQLFGAWRTFFERLAATGPVVMVFEDFHYADPGLIDFVDQLLQWSRTLPIYIVTLARPELLEKRPDWGAGTRNFTSLYLEPLSAEAMRALLAGLVPGLPEPTVRAVISRADGIPLYAVETVRMLLADGRLREDAGRYEPTGDLASLAVPETLTALIGSRLDSLPAEDRATVQDAAVLGQSFTLAGLAALTGLDPADLESRLGALVRREILTLEADVRSPERGQYAFVQALIREVAYNTLARADRKAKHLAAARWFEGLATDELAGAQAGHYLAAHANAQVGAEADALAAQARIALRGAADRAAALGSHEQALTYLQQAETITPDPTQLAAIWEAAGRAAEDAGRLEVARGYYERLAAERRRGDDRSAAARAIASLGRVVITSGAIAQALELVRDGSKEFPPSEGTPGAVQLAAELARAHMRMGQDDEAIEASDRALIAAERLELVEAIVESLTTKGTSLASAGRLREGLALLSAAVAMAESHGLVQAELRARQNLWFTNTDDPVAVVDTARPGLELARRLGLAEWTLDLNTVVAIASLQVVADWAWVDGMLREHEHDELSPLYSALFDGMRAFLTGMRDATAAQASAALIGAAAERLPPGGDPQATFNLACQRGWVSLAAGQIDDALQAADVVTRSDFGATWRVWGSAIGVKAAVWARDRAALEATAAILDLAMGRWPEVLRREARAALAGLDGDRPRALAEYRDVFERWDTLGMPLQSATCVIGACRILGPDPDLAEAVAGAREALNRLGAGAFLERLEEAVLEAAPAPSA
jgi:class 3 adenylate cyclase/tetratricopeptide (TPR) repeat protein